MWCRVARLLAVLSLAGCGSERGLVVVVKPAPTLKASCLELVVLGAGVSQDPIRLVRTPADDEYRVAFSAKGFPEQVAFRVGALVGPDGCEGTPVSNGSSPPVSATFPARGFTSVEVRIGPPDVSLDADRDGYVASGRNGPDCDDGDAAAFPGAAEACDGTKDLDCDGKVACADPDCLSLERCQGAQPVALAFTTPPRTVGRGACSEPVGLELRDAQGRGAQSPSDVAVELAAVPEGPLFFTDAACTTPVSGPLPLRGQATVHVRAPTAGVVTLSASALGLSPGTQTLTVQEASAFTLHFVTPRRSLTTDDCSEPMEVEARDAAGQPVPMPQSTTWVASAPPAARLQVFTDAACAMATTFGQLTVPPGESKARFFVRALAVGAPELSVAAAMTTATQALDVTPGRPSQLAFTTAPQAVATNACTAPLTVEVQDAAGNAVVLGAPLTLELTAAPALRATFSSKNDCADGITQVVVNAGVSSASFHARGLERGTATLTAATTLDGGMLAGTQQLSIGAGPPDHLAFTTPPRTVAAGGCSETLTVEVQDSANQPAAMAAGGTLTLSGTGLSFSSQLGCGTTTGTVPFPAGATSVTFHARGTTAGARTVLASLGGGLMAMQALTVTPGAGAALAFVSAPQTRLVGECSSALVVEVRDAFNNLVPNAGVVQLSASAQGPAFFAAAGCAGAPVTQATVAANGRAQAFARASLAGAFTLTAQGFATQAQQAYVVPPQAFGLRFIATPSGIPVGGCTTTLEVEAFDDAGQPTVAGSSPVALSASPDAAVQFAAACDGGVLSQVPFLDGGSRARFVARSTVAGTHTLRAQTSFGFDTASLSVGAGPVAGAAFTSPARTLPALECSDPLVVSLVDAFGNPTISPGGETLALSATPTGAGCTFSQPTDGTCTSSLASLVIPPGQGSASFRVSCLNAGPVLVLAANSTVSAMQTATLTGALAVALAVDAGAPLVTLPAAGTGPRLFAGECRAVTVERRDRLGRPASPSSPTTFSLAGDAPGLSAFTTQGCTTAAGGGTIAAGQSQVTLGIRALGGGFGPAQALRLVADAGSVGGAQLAVVRNAAQRLGCTIANGQATARCPVSTITGLSPHALFNTTVLVSQATGAGSEPVDALVACGLAADAGTGLDVVCLRNGLTGEVTVGVQTLSWPSGADAGGATVQHLFTSRANGTAFPLTFATRPVNPAQAFVLFSHSGAGNFVNANDTYTCRLTTGGTVEAEHGGTASLFHSPTATFGLQVVELAGASVDHLALPAGGNADTSEVTGLPTVDLTRSLVLHTARAGTFTSNDDDVCGLFGRTLLPAPGTVRYQRTNGNQGCANLDTDAIAAQRIALPASVDVSTVNLAFADGDTEVAIPLSVDVSRTVWLASGQTANGAGGGEGTSTGNLMGALQLRVGCDAATGTCTATRGSGNGSATFTLQAMQVTPR